MRPQAWCDRASARKGLQGKGKGRPRRMTGRRRACGLGRRRGSGQPAAAHEHAQGAEPHSGGRRRTAGGCSARGAVRGGKQQRGHGSKATLRGRPQYGWRSLSWVVGGGTS